MPMDAWANFLVAQVGASAALLGLLFVGVSLNLAKILSIAYLPDRALISLTLLFAILLLSTLLLIPGQSVAVIGAEVLGIGVAAWGFGTILELRTFRRLSRTGIGTFLVNLLAFELSTIPYIVGGALLLAGEGAGMYWVALSVAISLVKAVTDAWVLLIEINR